MRQSASAIRSQTYNDEHNLVCPNPDCNEKTRINMNDRNNEYTAYRCVICGQKWTVGYELVLDVRVIPKTEEK